MWILGVILFIIICVANGDSIGTFLIRGLLLVLFVGLCIVNPILGIAILAIGLLLNKKD